MPDLAPRMTLPLGGLVSVSGVAAFSLTFIHPAFWAVVLLVLAVAALLLALQLIRERLAEPPATLFALIWILATVSLAIANGAAEDFFNGRQIALVSAGLIFGYFLSLERVRPFAAWAPFVLFAAYFTGCMVMGRNPNEVFTRNSQNYISVVLLALYLSAVVMTRPTRVRWTYLATACLVLALSVWAAGRGGIISSLLLTLGVIAGMAFRGRGGLLRWLVAIFVAVAVLLAAYIGIGFLESGGYLYKFEGRGLRDPSRLAILIAYFDNIDASSFLLGRNYYDNSVIGQWGFNLHNSYLGAWAHVGLAYLLLVLAAIYSAFRHRHAYPMIAIATLAFAVRALTDTQLFSGQYDFVVFAVLFTLARASRERSQPHEAGADSTMLRKSK